MLINKFTHLLRMGGESLISNTIDKYGIAVNDNKNIISLLNKSNNINYISLAYNSPCEVIYG